MRRTPVSLAIGTQIDIVAKRKGRERLPFLPGCAERDRPVVPAIDTPQFVGGFESTISHTSEHQVLSRPQDGEIDQAVTVYIEWIRACHSIELGRRYVNLLRTGSLLPRRSRFG